MQIHSSKWEMFFDRAVKYAALPMLTIGLYVLFTGFEDPFAPGVPRWAVVLGFLLLAVNVLYLGAMLFLAGVFYRPWQSVSDRELPTCTVIVPAYNEGRGVLKALESLAASDYPAEKLEIIAIDDGSVDDTWNWICRAAQAAPDRIRTLRLPANRGKRHALHCGIRSSRMEVIVTVDSDSTVLPDTLRQLVSPLAADPAVGAVAGNIRVGNRDEGLIPRMMDVNFVFNFDLMRAGQSVMRSVFCTPGALSAYRREALLPFVDSWLEQKFLGEAAGIAEDRALSTNLLRGNWRIVFQRTAVAYTAMPVAFRNTSRMLLRWGRGDVRETLRLYRFAFRRFDGFHLGMQLQLLVQSMWLLLPILLLPITLPVVAANPVLAFQSGCALTLAWSSVAALLYLHRGGGSEALLAYVFSCFRLVFLFWITPWCVLTVRNSGWLTRGVETRRPLRNVGLEMLKKTIFVK